MSAENELGEEGRKRKRKPSVPKGFEPCSLRIVKSNGRPSDSRARNMSIGLHVVRCPCSANRVASSPTFVISWSKKNKKELTTKKKEEKRRKKKKEKRKRKKKKRKEKKRIILTILTVLIKIVKRQKEIKKWTRRRKTYNLQQSQQDWKVLCFGWRKVCPL